MSRPPSHLVPGRTCRERDSIWTSAPEAFGVWGSFVGPSGIPSAWVSRVALSGVLPAPQKAVKNRGAFLLLGPQASLCLPTAWTHLVRAGPPLLLPDTYLSSPHHKPTSFTSSADPLCYPRSYALETGQNNVQPLLSLWPQPPPRQ